MRATVLFLTFALGASDAGAQVCRLSVAGLNRARRVMGPIAAECPGPGVIHTAPFGNWGVTSNFGRVQNGHQFQGWCHDTYVCDNEGNCRTDCDDGWYEWNGCTDHPRFRAPNCHLYNTVGCMEQVSTTGVNLLGTQVAEAPVRCPFDSDDDGIADQGGCRDLSVYSHGAKFHVALRTPSARTNSSKRCTSRPRRRS